MHDQKGKQIVIIEGAISVKAAIESDKREIEKVYIRKDEISKDIHYIKRLCQSKNIEVIECDEDTISSLSIGKTNGGIIASVGERRMDEFSDQDIFYLDGIEDPFNLGYAMRTLYAFGIQNIYLSNRDYSNMESQLLKSSAGAYDKINIKIMKNDVEELRKLKGNYHIYGLYRGQNSKDVFETTFKDKCLFVLGGEKRGIKSDVLKLCDDYLYISYGSDFRNALNACAALDVVATLLYKQRKQ